MSQKEFAERLKISPASLSNILAGKTSPTNYHVQAVHNAFPDININWLFCGTGEMHTAPAPSPEADEFGFALETGTPQPGAASPTPTGGILETPAAPTSLDAQTARPATAPQRPLFAQEYASRQENAYAKPAGFQFSPTTPQPPMIPPVSIPPTKSQPIPIAMSSMALSVALFSLRPWLMYSAILLR